MTTQTFTKLLATTAVIFLVSGLIIQSRPRTAKADLPVVSAQKSLPVQIAGNAAPATQCMECHHSELISRIDQLTTDPSPDLRPAWSPDGGRLAFYSGRSGNDDIWIIDVDGNTQTQLTEDSSRDRRPAWSPDGEKIVFDSNRAGTNDIWIMNADGSDQKQLTTGPGQEMFASFSPDGSQVIYYGYEEGRNDIWTIDVDGGNPRSLTDGLADEKQSQCTFACHTPAFSPDGQTIAFHADNDGARNIWVMDADGSNPQQLTTTSSNSDTSNYLPSWSADGRIIFLAERPIAMSIRTDIRMINVDGSEEITLFTEVAHGGPFVWSPDGTQVALHSQRGGAGNFDIFVATLGEGAEGDQPDQDEAPANEEAPADEETPAEGQTPAEEASADTESSTGETDLPTEDESSTVDADLPAEGESSVEEEAPAEEASVAEEPSAEEEAPVSSEASGGVSGEAPNEASSEADASSAAATEDTASSSLGSTGTLALIGGSILIVLVVVGYGLRKFRRN